MARVLVVEDEADVRRLVRDLLEAAGFEVTDVSSGSAALGALYEAQPDIVLLDVGLPETDGWSVLGQIREVSEVPVLMLTARATEVDKVRGLRAGADDYLTKPFGRQELVARVEALMRRGGERRKEGRQPYSDALVEIDFAGRAVTANGRDVALTPLEYRMLVAFIDNPERVLSYDELLELVWGTTRGVSRDQVRLYVSYVRGKLGPPAADGIENVRGVGYRYRPSRSS